MLGMIHYILQHQGIVVKKCIVVKNPDALWVEIENFVPEQVRSAAQACSHGSNNQLFHLWSAEILDFVMLNFYHFFQSFAYPL